MLLVLAACRGSGPADPSSPHTGGPGSSAELASLDVGSPLTPSFDPDRSWYAVRASDLADPIPVVATPEDPDATVDTRVETVDGDDEDGLPASPDHRLVVDVTSADGSATRTYAVSLLPDDFPELTVSEPGTPSPGWFLLADFDFGAQPPGIGRYLMTVDDAGVPGWWRRQPDPSFDLRATPLGELSYVATGSVTPDLSGYLVDDHYDTVSERKPVLVDDFQAVTGDPHEFNVQPDGSVWLVGNAFRTEDLTAWGGGPSDTVLHQVVQHLDAEGGLLFSWSTVGVVDYGALPAAVWQAEATTHTLEPAHVNAIDLDPVDGDLVVSMRIPSRVVKLDPTDGTMLWSLGGPSSDFTFVGDDRDHGWQGFSEQHSARRVGEDHLMVFDNGTSADFGRVGTARLAEYVLDTTAMTATLVDAYVLPNGDATPAGGSVQRLADGHTLIGWGSLMTGESGRAPTLTELDGDDRVVFELTLPENLWTYRAWKAEGDPLTGRW